MQKLLLLVLTVLSIGVSAQKIDNNASYRNHGEKYFRFNYDNDFFAATDFNYTQGYMFEFAHPFFAKNPVNHLFLKVPSSNQKFGFALEHIGFTPEKIVPEVIQVGDRPFASTIMLRSFYAATDTASKYRITSALNVGVIGPIAFGEAMQVGIHKAIGDRIPKGWPNQISNDLVVNYELGYERNILSINRNLYVGANGNLKAGSLFTNASISMVSMFGLLNNPLGNAAKHRNFQLYGYAQPQFTVVGYDATLQGGLLNDSPYTINAADIERFTAQVNFGAVLTYKRLYLEYSQARIGKEFRTGEAAGWGGVKFGWNW